MRDLVRNYLTLTGWYSQLINVLGMSYAIFKTFGMSFAVFNTYEQRLQYLRGKMGEDTNVEANGDMNTEGRLNRRGNDHLISARVGGSFPLFSKKGSDNFLHNYSCESA
ncbi:hypothetical protein POVWA1_035900 [Plasmodium ovale wallikeri]|uniref:Uncharacterized protein n=1 Tax=Plasmodium ovale wallikeri TaxID=864142 RepID=A0A1A8Z0J1_PLAOA|nr:hypothetical protein POVWA1_035900 [Plasmodium ovale wallikeri]